MEIKIVLRGYIKEGENLHPYIVRIEGDEEAVELEKNLILKNIEDYGK